MSLFLGSLVCSIYLYVSNNSSVIASCGFNDQSFEIDVETGNCAASRFVILQDSCVYLGPFMMSNEPQRCSFYNWKLLLGHQQGLHWFHWDYGHVTNIKSNSLLSQEECVDCCLWLYGAVLRVVIMVTEYLDFSNHFWYVWFCACSGCGSLSPRLWISHKEKMCIKCYWMGVPTERKGSGVSFPPSCWHHCSD